jgi:hypothetical protein
MPALHMPHNVLIADMLIIKNDVSFVAKAASAIALAPDARTPSGVLENISAILNYYIEFH